MIELRADLRELAKTHLPAHMTDVDWDRHPRESLAMNRIATNLAGIPTVAGNELVLHSDTQAMLKAIASDIDRARHSVLIEFYIWAAGGTADEVLEAVIRAASRGVKCLVLIDYLGARPWWKSPQPGRLRAAGVEVVAARPTGLLRGLFDRNDLRIHRKIVVVDGEAAWTGSMNMVDPRFFKQESNVGQWIDALVRVEGTAVLPLATVFVADWHMETGQAVREIMAKAHLHRVRAVGHADVQVVPSGPESSNDAILQMLLGIIQVARDELVMTTPYFIPDDSMLRALRGAAARGVRVKLIVPARIDSMMVRYASRSYYDDLMEVGAQVYVFNGGLLHTKSITADGEVALIGTVNLDMRSLWLNSEVSLFVYDADFTKRLRALQETYLADCDELDLEEWMSRSFGPRLVENTFRLVSPLL
jgi:cardiolipin synthase